MERAFGWARLPSTGETVAGAEIRVYENGTLTPARIYDDDLSPLPTLKANPFFADVDGYWFFYAANGRYDIVVADGIPAIPVAYTIGDYNLGLGDCGPKRYADAIELPVSPPPPAPPPLANLAHAGRLAFVDDFGLYIDTAYPDGWQPVTSFGIPRVPLASLPPAGKPGRLRIVTDNVRGIWQDQGTFWFNIFGEVVNIQDFGAVGDGSADDTSAIQAAIDALASSGGGGAVLIPARTFGISSPLLLRNGTVLRGTSQVGSNIKALPSFVGDSLVRGVSRDDNTASNFESVGLYDCSFQAPAASPTPFAALDATGWHRSIVSAVRLLGAGTGVANQTAIRISDRNPTGTSHKDCIANRFENVSAVNWNRFVFIEEAAVSASSATVDNNSLEQFSASCRQGIIFGSTQLGATLALSSGLLAGDGIAGGGANVALNTIPPFTEINQLTVLGTAPFGDGSGALAGLRRALLVNTLFALGRAGTTQGAPTFVGGGTPEPFVSGAYVGIAAGTPLAAGVNLFTYTLTQAGTFVPGGASMLVFVNSGAPAALLNAYGVLSGDTLTLSVVMGSIVLALPANLVFRVAAVL